MKRICQCLKLKNDPQLISEYEYWHRPENIWPEVIEGLKKIGIINMEIYRNENQLFMVIDLPDDFNWEQEMQRLALLPKQREWEEFMSKFQDVKPSTSLKESGPGCKKGKEEAGQMKKMENVEKVEEEEKLEKVEIESHKKWQILRPIFSLK